MTEAELKTILGEISRANAALTKEAVAMGDRFVVLALEAQRVTLERMARLIVSAPDFAALSTSARLSWYVANSEAYAELIRGAWPSEAVLGYVSAFDRLAALSRAVVAAGGVDEAFLGVSARYLELLKARSAEYFSDFLLPEAVRKIDDVVFEMAVGGYTRGAMLDELQGVITGEYAWGERTGLYEWHAGTYARTASSQAAQAFLNEQATNAGVKDYLYLGPFDSKVRPFCQRLIGHVYDLGQIQDMDNGQTGDVYTDRGGWNCRHQWNPVSFEVAKEIREADDELVAGGLGIAA